MTISKNSYAIRIRIALALAFLVALAAGCVQGTPYGTEGAIDDPQDCDHMVIVTVGEVEITLASVFADPQFYQFMEERIIKPEVVRQEAASRGVVVELEEIQDQIEGMYAMSGGYEQFMGNMAPSLPRELLDDDILQFFTLHALITALAEDQYDELFGTPTETQIMNEWQLNENRYRMEVAQETGVEESEVTLEMARDKINDAIRYEWVQANMMPHVAEFTENYEVRNFLRERIPDTERPGVPLVDQFTFELDEGEDHPDGGAGGEAHEADHGDGSEREPVEDDEHQEEDQPADDEDSDESASDAGHESGE